MSHDPDNIHLPEMPLPPGLPPDDDFPCCAPTGFSNEPLLTASEVKVLTETASKVAYALGRKDAGEEIAQALEAEALSDYDAADDLHWAAEKALAITSQAAGAASDATSGVPGHPEVSEAARSPQEPYECSCYKLPRWPDGLLRHHPDCPNATEGNTP